MAKQINSLVPSKTPALFRLSNWFLDAVLARIRIILFPFWLLATGFQWISLIFSTLSNEYQKRSFGYCGQGVRIHGRFRVTAPNNLHVEGNVHINANAFLRAEGKIFIGENTHISRNLVVYSMNHNYTGALLPYDSEKLLKPVKIGPNVWIGMNVTITPGVSIGEGAVIGMGTVVSRDVLPLAIVGSPPLRVLKQRNSEHYEGLRDRKRFAGMSGYSKGRGR